MHNPLPLLLVPVAALISCIADATDEPVGDVTEPGIQYGSGRPAPELGPVEASHAWLAGAARSRSARQPRTSSM